MTTLLADHWDAQFRTRPDPALGWWEEEPSPTVEMLAGLPDWQSATIFIPGVGTSRLVDRLIGQAAHLVLNDISGVALARLRERLGPQANRATWLCQDIAAPLPPTLPPVQLWLDRAVLHFLHDEEAIAGYFANLRGLLVPGGYALFAEFAPNGATHCASLPVHRYSVAELAARLGGDFALVAERRTTTINPRGEPRPYLYALFARERSNGHAVP